MRELSINRRELSKIIFDNFKTHHSSIEIKYIYTGEGFRMIFKNSVGFYCIGVNILDYSNKFVIGNIRTFICFKEIEEILLPFLNELDSMYEKHTLLNRDTIDAKNQFRKYDFQREYEHKLRIDRPEDIDKFNDFLDEYYQNETLPFVNYFSSIDILYDFFQSEVINDILNPKYDISYFWWKTMILFKLKNEEEYQKYVFELYEYSKKLEGLDVNVKKLEHRLESISK